VTAGSNLYLLQLNWKVLWNTKWRQSFKSLFRQETPNILLSCKFVIQGYGPEHDFWEPEKNVVNAPEMVSAYLKILADKQAG
jgi:hypothetical protein